MRRSNHLDCLFFVCLFLCARGRGCGRLQLDFSGLFNIGIFLHNFSLGIIKIDVYSVQHENPLQSLKDLCVALMNSIINLSKMQITTWIACHYEHGRICYPARKFNEHRIARKKNIESFGWRIEKNERRRRKKADRTCQILEQTVSIPSYVQQM